MADGSGGAPGAVAETAAKIGGSLFNVILGEVNEFGKGVVSQTTGTQFGPTPQSSQQRNPQKSTQQMKQEDTDTSVPRKAAIKDELKKIELQNQTTSPQEQALQNIPQQTTQPQNQGKPEHSKDKNGQNPVIAKRLFEEVQQWGEDALQRQKQQEAQKRQQEEMEAEQKKEEQENRTLEAPIMPGSATKGPGAKKQQTQPLAVSQAQNKGETGRSAKG